MTGGRVTVIGQTGRNFAAGMSGGIAYVYDGPTDGYAGGQFPRLCNKDQVSLDPLQSDDDKAYVKRMLENHLKYTGSPVAQTILDGWETELKYFVRVMPNDFRRVLEERAKREAGTAGQSPEQMAATAVAR
jgi:glutamate synthase (NADPH/NADH) large chain